MKKIGLLVITAALMVACAAESTQKPLVFNSFKGNGFTIDTPEGWEKEVSSETKREIVSYIAPFDNETEYMQENFNVSRTDFTGTGVTLDDFARQTSENLSTVVANAKILGNERISVNGKDCQKISYTTKQEVYDLVVEQYCFLENEICYVITVTMEQKMQKEYAPTFKKVIDSFKLS